MKNKNTYLAAGIDEESGAKFSAFALAKIRKNTQQQKFASCSQIPNSNQYLVSSCDGIGSKLLLLKEYICLEVAGYDLVAACVNDLATQGAQPFNFLDSISCNSINQDDYKQVLKGIIKACKVAKCEFVGGELAQLPDQIKKNKFDVVGFANGLVAKDKKIDINRVLEKDLILGIQTNTVHCNGYTLIRKILQRKNVKLTSKIKSILLSNTPIYSNVIHKLNKQEHKSINAIANITGGGLIRNIPRIIPNKLTAKIDIGSWDIPKVFTWIMEVGKVDLSEMLNVFNCGIGVVLIIKPASKNKVIDFLAKHKFTAKVIGEVVQGSKIKFINE